ncbi:reverse transcriptase domain-containing protein [Tanacetum coccineum]
MYLRLCIEDGYGWDGNAGIIKAGTVFREPPYPFNYPTRRLTMKEMLAKFIDEENLKQLDINISFIEALVQIPKYAKYLKSLLTNKSRLEEACTETTNKRCSAVLLNELPSKEKDLRNFTIPCQVLEKHKEAEDLAADHLSRFKSLHMEVLTEREIADKFSDKHLMVLKSKFKDDEPWYVDFVNYIVGKVVPPNWTFEKRKRCFSQVKTYFWEEPFAFKLCADNIMRRCVARSETLKILAHCHSGTYRVGIVVLIFRNRGLLVPGFYWPSVFKDANEYVRRCDACQRSGNISSRNEMPQNKSRFGVPKALISDRGTHFCNSQLEKALQRYGVTHKLSMAYHPQSNGQTEVTNRAIKRILERSVGYNPKDCCLYGVSKPYGYGDRLSGRYPVFIFSTIDTAYSLNEYSVFNIGPRWNENDEDGGVFINLEI